jgi:hypothetical protein
MRFYIIPIEPLEERYSSQWALWFENYFSQQKRHDYEFIKGDTLTNSIIDGSFLDVCGTNFYKASQLQKICKIIHNNKPDKNTVFFFHDLWFPGIEMLAYMRQGLSLDFKIAGCLHAGTYDQYDFLYKAGMKTWGKSLEESWFNFIDKIFVATNFHKKMILKNRCANQKKIIVTGFPIFPQNNSAILWKNKENLVVFPHRLDSEKRPELFKGLSDYLSKSKKAPTALSFVRTMDVWHGKKEVYYDILQRAKIAVSFARQETWGIAMQEALFAGAIPIVPNRLSYKEMYSDYFIYKDFHLKKIADFIIDIFRSPTFYINIANQNKKTLINKGREAIPNMIKELQLL